MSLLSEYLCQDTVSETNALGKGAPLPEAQHRIYPSMSVPDTGLAWSYGDDHEENSQQNSLKTEAPLQYAALYAQSQPVEGKVSLKSLESILARARLPNDASATLLEYCVERGTDLVTEQGFYWALAQAACYQSDPSHTIVPETESPTNLPMRELNFTEVNGDLDHALGNDNGTWEVPEYNPTTEHTLRVSLVDRDAGSFFTKHAVYSVDGSFKGTCVKVLRRFRDFASLDTHLTQTYTFRALPVLPPKRLSMNGRYLVGETQDEFLLRRASGLARYVNLLAQHPILSKDTVFERFLFADTHFDTDASTQKRAKSELTGKTASPIFILHWNETKLQEWSDVENATREILNQTTTLCMIMERQIKRLEREKADMETAGRSFTALSRFVIPLYSSLPDDLPTIQQRLEQMPQYADNRCRQLTEDAEELGQGPLTQLKLYRDMVSSVLEMLRRVKSHGKNTIPEQQRMISGAQKRLLALSTREDVKDDDLHKLRMKIQLAQASIREQTDRDWLIKMIVSQELEMVQTMQYQISVVLRSMAKCESDSSSKHAELTLQMADALSSAPLKV